MDEKKARQLLGERESGTSVAVQPPGMSQAAGAASLGIRLPQESFETRNFRGLPIDMSEGLNVSDMLGTEFRDDPQQKAKYLEGIYGGGNVRFADDGTLLIKVVGNDNTPKEVPLSPPGIQLSDVPRGLAYIPETIGALTTMKGARKLPFIGKLGAKEEAGFVSRAAGFGREVLAEAVGQEAGGALKDIAVGEIDVSPMSAREVLEGRAKRIPMDVAVGTGLGLTGKALSRGITPFPGTKGQVEQDVLDARKFFQEEYGIDFPLTAGEKTGNKLLQRTEATMSRLPGGIGAATDLRAQKTEAVRRIINRVQGLPEDLSAAEMAAFPTEEQVGNRAIAAIRSKVEPLQRAAEIAKSDVAKAAHQQILNELESATTAGRQLYPEKVGQSIRARAIDLRSQFQDQSKVLYDEAYSLPGGTDRILSTPSLVGKAETVIKSLPPKDQITEVASPIRGPRGEVITHKATGEAVNKEFVPSGVLSKLKSLSELGEQKFSLRDLVQMRTDVANEIAQGEAIPGVQTHYLGKIRDMLTSSIEEAVNAAPNGNLKTAWQKANAFYRENVGKFHEGPVARLFKDIESPGFIRDEDIIRNIGSTEYGVFKKFLGADSPEFNQMKGAILDELLKGSTDLSGAIVNGKAFAKDLTNFYKEKRAIAEDMFGKKALGREPLIGGTALSVLSNLIDDAGSAIDPVKLRGLLRSGTPLGKAVETLVKEQEVLNKAYRSKIVKDIAERKLGESFDATEFVNRFYKQASPEELKSVISQLADHPLTLQDLRQKITEKVLFEAQRAAKDTDPSRTGLGDPFRPPGSSSLEKVMGDATQRERMQIALGDTLFNDLVQMGKLLRGGEVSEQAFASAGGFATTTATANLVQGGLFSYGTNWMKQKAAALLLTAPVLRQWVGGEMFAPINKFFFGTPSLSRAQQAKIGRALILSTPFVEAVSKEFGPTKAGLRASEEFIDGLMQSIGLYEKYGGNTGHTVETPEGKEERMRKLLREPAEPKVRPAK